MAVNKELIEIVDEKSLEQLCKTGKFKDILNRQPKPQWIKNHPFAKGVRYLPIDKIELMLDMLFKDWRVEILDISQLAQSICCTVRLHFLSPATGQWGYHDGVGAVPLKTRKGMAASDMANILSDAVATGAPAAKSFAIKDAAEHLGNRFGRNINRKDTVAFKNLYNIPDDEEQEDYRKKLMDSEDIDELRSVWQKMPEEVRSQKTMQLLKDEMKIKLGGEDEN